MHTKSPHLEEVISLVLALAGSVLLAWLFWSAQESSQSIGVLVMQGGYVMLIAEFFAIYAGGITSGKQVEAERNFSGKELPTALQKWRVVPVVLFVLAALAVGWLAQYMWLAFFFVVSFLAKYFGHRAVRFHPLTVVSLIWFLLSLGVLIIPESFLQNVLRLVSNPPENIDRILSWGVVYFTVSAVITSILFAKEFGRTTESKRSYEI